MARTACCKTNTRPPRVSPSSSWSAARMTFSRSRKPVSSPKSARQVSAFARASTSSGSAGRESPPAPHATPPAKASPPDRPYRRCGCAGSCGLRKGQHHLRRLRAIGGCGDRADHAVRGHGSGAAAQCHAGGHGPSSRRSRSRLCAALRFHFLRRQQGLGRIDRLFAGGCKPAPLPGMRGPP